MANTDTIEPVSTKPGNSNNHRGTLTIALLGNPNTGKTTLFNALSGLRARTANFPGITVEAKVGNARITDRLDAELIDLPGVYSMELDLPESRTVRDVLEGNTMPRGEKVSRPDAAIVVVDATNIARNLVLVGETLKRGMPTVVAVNMIDVARRKGLVIDAKKLGEALGCSVVRISARSGEGIDELRQALENAQPPVKLPPADLDEMLRWTDEVYASAGASADALVKDTFTDRLDHAFTHPLLGLLVFGLVMGGLFYTIFYFARYPMGLVENLMSWLGSSAEALLPAGVLNDLLVDGVIAGIGGVVIFLPQIVLLFFLLSLLEDTGYLARAAFVMDRLFRHFGLPGQAFVPMLSAHACAIPGIMATRLIPDRRDRLATILVAPFMTCSARLPVYVLCISLLFSDRPVLAAVTFFAAYTLGAVAAMFSALVAKGTILRGRSRPMALELPTYKLPSLRNAAYTAWDRSLVFLKQAGTIILAISIIMWGLSRYPGTAPLPEADSLRTQAQDLAASDADSAAELFNKAEALDARNALEHSFAGRLGRTIEPIFRPLGYDWRMTIGVLSSFAAREVYVSTMAVIMGAGDDTDVSQDLLDRMRAAKRDDGSPLFTTPVSASLLVFYVLAMQCLPTMVMTRRESGSWKWVALQFCWMTGVAYVCAFITFHGLNMLGVA